MPENQIVVCGKVDPFTIFYFQFIFYTTRLSDEPLLITCLSPKGLKIVSNSEFHADSEDPFLKCRRRRVFSENGII